MSFKCLDKNPFHARYEWFCNREAVNPDNKEGFAAAIFTPVNK